MAQPTHDPHSYYEDGNIVLRAFSRSQNSHIVYCLHRSILVKHSPVFANMFTMPPPPTVAQYAGIPLVDMPDDADALGEFIRILYDSQYFSKLLIANDFTLKLLGPCQLANKYQADWIRDMTAEKLRQSWPDTLVGWLGLTEEEREQASRDVMGDFNGDWEPEWEDPAFQPRRLPEPVTSILLARECDVPSILPPAFLDLLRCLPEPDPIDPWLAVYDKKIESTLLPADDWHRLYRARERMGKWFSDYPYPPPSSSNETMTACKGPTSKNCEAAIYRTWLAMGQRMARCGDILQSNLPEEDTKGICLECLTKLNAEVGILQQQFWKKLIYFFSLD
ncbi:hypothetical protein R3P38DRAFT_3039976 [Favolaschia claudopus]|uniref:BTB domain-containing protein n=1 Tax=Favolaschia claudopus TaxID=2862362 RepID=A0AAW0AAL0_9AGAR